MGEELTAADLMRAAAPKSDQINAEDLLGGPRTFTLLRAVRGPSEQPVQIELAEAKPWRPCKSMQRVLIAAWGPDPSAWPRPARATLYCDPNVTFGADKVGGIRVSHLSHIREPLKVALTVTKGKRRVCTVQPLREQAPPLADVLSEAGCTIADCDSWLTSKSKPATGDGDTSRLAAWLVANPKAVDEIREIAMERIARQAADTEGDA